MASGLYRGGYRAGYRGAGYVPGYPGPDSVIPTTGLKLWLRGDVAVTVSGGTVTAWADQSGNGNDVVAGGAAPFFTASAINGLPGAHFNGPTQILHNVSSNAVPSGSDRHIIAVVQPQTGAGVYSPGGSIVCFKVANPVFLMYLGTASGTSYGYSNGSQSDSITSPPTLTNVSFIAEMAGAVGAGSPTYVLNGTAFALSNSTGVVSDTGTVGFAIGNAPASLTQFFAGFICEVIVYDHILSAGDLAAVRAYLKPKYGISF